MSNSWFEFKRFRIEQEGCSMKVGTDGVLLGAWFDLSQGMRVLDVGSGSGLIAIMAAQRGAGSVTAVEIETAAAAQAQANAEQSPWAAQIDVQCMDIAQFTSDVKYDRVVCNPPFFRNSLRCSDGARNRARHNDTLSFESLVACAERLLTDHGRLSVVLPIEGAEVFIKCAAMIGLCLCRRTDVVTVQGKAPKRSLLEFARSATTTTVQMLCMVGADGQETSGYISLVREFYLKY